MSNDFNEFNEVNKLIKIYKLSNSLNNAIETMPNIGTSFSKTNKNSSNNLLNNSLSVCYDSLIKTKEDEYNSITKENIHLRESISRIKSLRDKLMKELNNICFICKPDEYRETIDNFSCFNINCLRKYIKLLRLKIDYDNLLMKS